jgi:hypothetical protein
VDAMIEAFIGKPGSGKTYSLVDRALTEAKRGRQVFSNFLIDHENCWTYKADQLMDLPRGVIIIDEAHLWFSARNAINLPPSWLAMISQTRKNHWDLYWTAQHELRVDTSLRHVTNTMWLCQSWFNVGGHPMFFKSAAYEPEYFRRQGKKVGTRTRLFNEGVANSFNTYERLDIADHLKFKNDMYRQKSQANFGRAA